MTCDADDADDHDDALTLAHWSMSLSTFNRQPGQTSAGDVAKRDLKKELEAAEAKHFADVQREKDKAAGVPGTQVLRNAAFAHAASKRRLTVMHNNTPPCSVR